VTSVSGDVTDRALIDRILMDHGIDTVFHLAAQSIVGIANADPLPTFDANIAGSYALLESCRHAPTVQQIVVASSDKAYGRCDDLPYTEETPLRGMHPYDVSKACADMIAQTYAHTYRTPVTITRCGNLYGGRDVNWNRIVPGTIRSVLRGERPVIRSDGNFVRDYFYVEDAVEAYLLLAERLAANPDLIGEAFNFSTETPATVLEIATAILAAMGSDLSPDVRNEASGEIRAQYLDAAKAKRVLGWSSAWTLDDGLDATIAWYRNSPVS
jgi:CDP-glucose 4,6-dehydratase